MYMYMYVIVYTCIYIYARNINKVMGIFNTKELTCKRQSSGSNGTEDTMKIGPAFSHHVFNPDQLHENKEVS